MSTTADSHLSREVDALRECLAVCLQRLDDVERRMGGSARRERAHAPASGRAAFDVDPFEWALPASGGDGANVPPPQPTVPHEAGAPGRFTIRAVMTDDAVAEPTPVPPDASETLTGTLHDSDWDAQRPSGDGSPDPFAFVHIPLISPASEETSDLYRGMDALLGGLDVTTPDGPPGSSGKAA